MRINFTRKLLIAAIVLISGCSKEKLLRDSTKTAPTESMGVRSAADREYDFLGYGYDVTGEYANPSAARYLVVDVAKLKREHTTRVDIDPSQFSYPKLDVGENSEDYTKNLSAKFEVSLGLKLFTGTIKSSYSDSSKFSSKYLYSSYENIIHRKALKFSADNELLRKYLSAAFITDAQNSTPQNIVARYGTHVLSNIVLGGKISFLYRSETKNTDRIKAATAGINMPLVKIFGITADITTDSKESQKNYSQSINYKTVGGDPTVSLIGQIPIGKDLPVINVTPWQSSVTIENSQLIDIRSNGLIPIYELIPDAGKRSLVKAYVEQYILNSQTASSPEPIYQFYHSAGNHYTSPDMDAVDGFSGWQFEGVSFKAHRSQVAGTKPVYLFYQDPGFNHHISMDINAVSGHPNWTYFGVSFYAYPTQVPGSIPIYLYYNHAARKGDHFTTPNPNLDSRYWTNYGIAFYAFPAN